MHRAALPFFEILRQIPGNRGTHRHGPGDRRGGPAAGPQLVPQSLNLDRAIVPDLVSSDPMHGGWDSSQHCGMRGPCYCGNFADHATGPGSFTYQPVEVRDFKTEPIALAEIAMVEAVHRYEHHRNGLLRAQREGK